MPTYATRKEVKDFTGVQPSWLGLGTDDELDTWLDEWIGKASEDINDHTGNSWTDSDLPGIVNTVTIRYVANVIKAARRHRAEQVMRVDDLTEGRMQALQPADTFLTKPLQDSLAAYVVRRQVSYGSSGNIRVLSPLGDEELSPFARATFGDWTPLAYRFPRVLKSQVGNRL